MPESDIVKLTSKAEKKKRRKERKKEEALRQEEELKAMIAPIRRAQEKAKIHAEVAERRARAQAKIDTEEDMEVKMKLMREEVLRREVPVQRRCDGLDEQNYHVRLAHPRGLGYT